MTIPIFDTYVAPEATTRVAAVLDSTFLSEGAIVREFEHALSEMLGLVRPVALNSGTSALHLAVVLAGVGRGDEVICPAQTFVASALAVMQAGGTPVFADIDYDSGNVTAATIERKLTERTKAIMVVHWGGTPCDMHEIATVADKHGVPVIEDAAHALGATYRGRPVGALSRFTCFSFQAIKHVSTGDGGALSVITQDDEDRARALRWFGIDRARSRPSPLGERVYDIAEVGYKYHLNDYSAALGLANLAGYPLRLAHLRRVADVYRRRLEGVPGIKLFRHDNDRESAYWLFGLHAERRDDLIEALRGRGIVASVVHQRIDRNSVFGGIRHDLENQARFDGTQIHIPIHARVTLEAAEQIADAIRKGW